MLTKTEAVKTQAPKAQPSKSSKSQNIWKEREQWVSSGSFAYSSVVIDRALNATVWDADGKEYLDFAGGIGAQNTGHCHPEVVKAIREQAGKLLHTSFHVAAYDGYVEVCKRLSALISGKPKKAILFNSGSEAVENAVKFAKAYTKRQAVIAFERGFHGRTLLCLALDGKYKPLKQNFGPLPSGIFHSAYPYPYRAPRGVKVEELTQYCLEALDNLFLTEVAAEDVAAIIVEPVQGEGGFVVPTPGFLKGLRQICDKHGIVLIVDEVQTGFGRTGKMFAFEHDGIEPDLVTVGKSLAGGMPISAVVGKAAILDAVQSGAVGGTYGGNPVSCAAALAVFEIFEKEKILAKAQKIGRIIEERFDFLAETLPIVGESRGLGAMRALELVESKQTRKPLPAARVKEILHSCQDRGLILLKAGTYDNVLRTLMPVTISESDLKRGLDILEGVLKEFKA